jgi:hypothetical protein
MVATRARCAARKRASAATTSPAFFQVGDELGELGGLVVT